MPLLALRNGPGRLRRLLGFGRRPAVVLGIVILAGLSITLWARARIDALLLVSSGARINLHVSERTGDCGTPALYVVGGMNGETSAYSVLVDFLGGPNRFSVIGGETTVPVLALPVARPPGVGLGRGLPERCAVIDLQISGDFADAREDRFPALAAMALADRPNITWRDLPGGGVGLRYERAENSAQEKALVSLKLSGVSDRWQSGQQRTIFANTGKGDVNVFMYDEAGYQFVNEMDAVVRPIGTRRAYVDVNLAPPNEAQDNTVVVYRRRATSDIELQHDLIGISTVFGIGVSLIVEGLLVLVISIASSPAGHGIAAHRQGTDLEENNQEQA
jgi:hypothetical protein